MRKYEEAERQEIIRKFKESGKTAAQFGRDNQLNPVTLLRWVKAEKRRRNNTDNDGEIVELNVGRIFTKTKDQLQSTSIVLGLNGCVLQIGDGFNQATLKNILDVVKQL